MQAKKILSSKKLKTLILFSLCVIFYPFPSVIFAQPKINKITWVGTDNEYLKISKKTASFNNGNIRQYFHVNQHVKGDYIILSKICSAKNRKEGKSEEQKYSIIRFTADTLILAPEGNDILNLCKMNEQKQCVFVNKNRFSPQTIQFISLYFETKLGLHTKIALFIDSTKLSQIFIYNRTYEEKTEIKSPIDPKTYYRLISILENYDIGRFPEEYFMLDDDVQCSNSFFEIKYNDQIKRCKSCAYFPFNYAKLESFIRNHIEVRAGLSIGAPRIYY